MSQKIIFEIAVEDANRSLDLSKFREELKKTDKELKELGKDGAGFRELALKAAETRAEIAKITKEQRELRKEFQNSGVAKDSLVGLRLEYGKLVGVVEKLSEAERKSPFGQSTIKQASVIKTQINSIEQSLGRFTGQVGNYKAGIASIAQIVSGGLVGGGLVLSINAITNAFSEGLDEVEAYGAGLSRLSSITGITGEALKDLEARANNLTTIKVNGQEIVNTAQDIFEAFTLVGSARPELLKDAAALEEVSKQAIVLSKASGDDLKTSVEAVTTTLGQFQLPASSAVDIVNQLAAGSKEGASEIRDTTVALQKFGTTAAVTNVNTAESIALIETLADRQIKGEAAGVQLRNILAKLAGADILPKKALVQLKEAGVDINVLKDTTLPLIDRLTELGKLQGNTAALTKVFGLENLSAAQILTQGIPKYKELLSSIQGTNEAYKQAGINADNLQTRIQNLKNKGINVLTQAFLGLEPAIESTVDFVGDLLGILSHAPEIIEDNAAELAALALIILSFNKNVQLVTTSLGRQAIAQAITTTATEAAEVATAGLGAVMNALPLIAIVAGLYAIVKAFELYEESASASEKASRAVADAQSEIAVEAGKELVAVQKNIAILSDEKASKDSRKKAIQELTAAYPEYLKGMNLEKANLTDLTILQDRLTSSIIRSVAERKKGEATAKIAGDIIEEQFNLDKLRNQRDNFRPSAQAGLVAGLSGVEKQRADQSVAQSEARLAKLRDQLQKTGEAFDKAFGIGNELTIVIPDKGDVIDLTKMRTDELKDSTDKLTDSNDKNSKSTKKQKDEIKAAADSIADLRSRVQQAQELLEKSAPTKPGPANVGGFNTLNETLLSNLKELQAELTIREAQLKRALDAKQNDVAPDVNPNDLLQGGGFVTTDPRAAFRRNKTTPSDVGPVELSDAQREALIENNAQVVDSEEFTTETIADLYQMLADKKIGLSDDEKKNAEETAKARVEFEKQVFDAVFETASNIEEALFSIRRNRIEKNKEAELTALDVIYKKRLDLAQGNSEQEKKIQKEFEEKKAAIEKKAEADKKRLAIREAQINTAVAITKALTGGPPPLSFVLAGVQLAAGIAQIAAIKKFNRGGVAKSGTFSGKPHSAGGTKGYFDDGTQIEVEADEDFIILNKRASAERRRYSNLNYKFGGNKFADGGALSFTPQFGQPGGSGGSDRIVVVNTGFTEDQVRAMAQEIAQQTAKETKQAIADGLYDADRKNERNKALTKNRTV